MPETLPLTPDEARAMTSLWVELGREAADGSDHIARDALTESAKRFDVLLDLMPQMVWSTLPDGFHDYYNERWYEYTGVPRGSTDGEGWNGMFHADDQERAWARWRQSLESGEPYEIEYRLRHSSGAYRWVLGRALPVRDVTGAITRWIGTCTDIHDAKLQAEQNFILSRELSHRIKNIFAVIQGLIGQSARNQPDKKEFARELQGRVGSLGRAHDFVRPHTEESRPEVEATTLKGLLVELFAPYPAQAEGRFTVTGDDAEVDDRGATPIGLVMHELATNSAKYGALSTSEGRVEVDVAGTGDEIVMTWRESGGPKVSEPTRTGFGSRLTELSINQQLGGRFEREFRPEGLFARITVARDRLART